VKRTWQILVVAVVIAVAGCKREERKLRDDPPDQALFSAAREGSIVPGGKIGQVGMKSPDEGNAYAISQGQKLFMWYNCAGCHGVHGGGAIGPPLMSNKLIYGSEPENIYDTIMKGRPRGMPSWGGRIPESQIWQLVAYVRSLSGSEPPNATSARSDYLETKTKAQLK
jgi:cytochrome c oxidase cbb3-type subunit III